MVVSMRFPEVACMHVGVKRARSEKIDPFEEVIALRIVIRKEAGKLSKKTSQNL